MWFSRLTQANKEIKKANKQAKLEEAERIAKRAKINEDTEVVVAEDKRLTDFSDDNKTIVYCKNLSLKDCKANMNDPISFLTQICEGKLNCRPNYEFE